MSDAKLQAMASALWPYIRAKLREEQDLHGRPKGPQKNFKVYIPELDYIISLYRLRQEVKIAKYNNGRLETIKGGTKHNRTYYCTGASEMLPNGTFVDDIFIPTKALLIIGDAYGVNMKDDFRVGRAEPIYSGGITSDKGSLIKGSASCYPIRLTTPITQEIIDNTREEWQDLTEEQLAKRLVRRTHMMEVLDILEQGQIDCHRQLELWRVLETQDGQVLTYEEAEALDHNDWIRVKPKKVTASWMGNEV